jgi:arylsulfatase
MPLEGGFDRSYYLEDVGRYFHPLEYYEDDRRRDPVERNSGYYATTAIADHGIGFLADHAARYRSQPFFLYLAFNAPHFPLQAKAEDIERYRGRYREGWESIRAQRARRIHDLGILKAPLSEVERQVGPPNDDRDALKVLGPDEVDRPVPWDSLTVGQRAFQSEKMAVHAAMVDRMDREIGRVLAQLRKMEVFDDTLIIFLSDNGASAEIMVRDDGHDPAAPAGSARSHLCLGPGWSTVANTPFRRHKAWVHEGGISTPFIVHWPSGIKARGELRRDPGHVIDFVPTIRELTGAPRLAEEKGVPAPSVPGLSLVPAIARDGGVEREALWWEHNANRAIRVGDWKLVAAGKDGPWELYDLANDRTETRDLSRGRRSKVLELAGRGERLRDEFAALVREDSRSAYGKAP